MEPIKVEGTIRSVTPAKEFQGVLQLGFTIHEKDMWFNIPGTQEELDQILEDVIVKGNKISFDLMAKDISELKLVEKGKVQEKSGHWADDMVTFEVLLNKAHEMSSKELGGLHIKTHPICNGEGNPMIDVKDKFALFTAEVTLNGQTFTGHGDATSENIDNAAIGKHFIRMAETRAIVRALRFATNDARCAVEETENSGVNEKGEM